MRELYRALSCSDFIISFNNVIAMASQAPASPQVGESADVLAAQTLTGICITTEIFTLNALITELESAFVAIEDLLTDLFDDFTGKELFKTNCVLELLLFLHEDLLNINK